MDTEQLAASLRIKPASIRVRLCNTGSYYCLLPVKLPNRRLMWPVDSIEQLSRPADSSSLLSERITPSSRKRTGQAHDLSIDHTHDHAVANKRLPKMVGQAVQYTSEPGNKVYEIGKALAEFGGAQEARPDLQAQEVGAA